MKIRYLLLICLFAGCAGPRDEPSSTLTFPPEWAPQEAVWMGWTADPAPHNLQLRMIEAMAPRVRIRLLVQSDSTRAVAEDSLRSRAVDLARVEFVTHPSQVLWTRDPGPRFLTDGRRLAVADLGWTFYGFPPEMVGDGLMLASLDDDLAQALDLPLVSSLVVAEGGGIEASSRCLLSYADIALERNPGRTLDEIERELLRVYGKETMIWLDRCPLSDRVRPGPKVDNWYGFGANGHIDEYVRFVNDSTLVIAQVDSVESLEDPVSRADFEILRENLAQLLAARDPDGKPFHIVPLPVPRLTQHMWTGPLTEVHRQNRMFGPMVAGMEVGQEIHVVPAVSYLNFFITNGLVLVPAYGRPGLPESELRKDVLTKEALQGLFPEREIIQIDPTVINWGGGGMHCITQQQPAVG